MLAVWLVIVLVGANVLGSDIDMRRGKVERAIKSKNFLKNGEGVNGLKTKMRSKKGQLQNDELSHARPHPVFPVPSWSMMASRRDTDNSICDVNTNLWECLGSDRDWSLVSLMDKDGERRMESIPRLLSRTQLLVVSTRRASNLPTDFRLLNTFWNGRRCFTQAIPEMNDEDEISVLIQGDLDATGELFDAVVAKIKSVNAKEIKRENKPKKNYFKSELLLMSGLFTTGDILELGTDQDTTELLHTVVQTDNAQEKESSLMRMLVTADSSSSWLSDHSVLLCSFHQFVFVPLYNNGVGCRQHQQSGMARELHGKLRGQTARKITCTHLQG